MLLLEGRALFEERGKVLCSVSETPKWSVFHGPTLAELILCFSLFRRVVMPICEVQSTDVTPTSNASTSGAYI